MKAGRRAAPLVLSGGACRTYYSAVFGGRFDQNFVAGNFDLTFIADGPERKRLKPKGTGSSGPLVSERPPRKR
jgi:hypothetical protein